MMLREGYLFSLLQQGRYQIKSKGVLMKKIEKILSIDIETSGLKGKAFMVAAVLYDNKKEIAKFVGRTPIEGEVNEWVQNSVLPNIKNIPENYGSHDDLLKDFAQWYQQYTQNEWHTQEEKDVEVLWHMGHAIEAHLFKEMYDKGYINEWDPPYAPIEMSTYLHIVGEKRDNISNYMEKYSIERPELPGGIHSPLYDCIATAKVFYHIQDRLMQKLDQNIESELNVSTEDQTVDVIAPKI